MRPPSPWRPDARPRLADLDGALASRLDPERIRISGFEEWTLDDDGRVAESQGHYDQAEYDRQLQHGADGALSALRLT